MNFNDLRGRRTLPRTLASFVLAGVFLANNAAHAQKASGTPAPASASAAPSAAPIIALADIAERSQSTIDGINAMTAAGPADQSLAAARESMPGLSAEASQWLSDSRESLDQRLSLDAFRDLQSSGYRLADKLNVQSGILNERAKTFDDDIARLGADETLWTATDQAAIAASAPPDTRALCKGVLDAVKDATAKLKARRTGVLELQSQLSTLTGNLNAALESVRQANAAALKSLLVRDSPPLWAPQTAANTEPVGGAMEPPSKQSAAALAYAYEHLDLMGVQAAIFLGLLGLLLWLKRGLAQWTLEEPALKRAAPIFDVPMATSLALSFVLKGNLYANSPVAFKAFLGVVLLVPMIVLLRRLLDKRLHGALYFLILFYVTGEVRTALASYVRLDRWIFSGELLAATVVFWWVAHTDGSRTEDSVGAVLGKWPRRLCRLAILLLVAAMSAEVLGFVRLGTTLGAGVLRGSYAAVFFYALIRVLAGLLLIALRVRPLSVSHIARQHHSEVHRRIVRLLGAVAFLGWLWLTLDFFELQTVVSAWLAEAVKYKLSAGTLSLTAGQLLGFVAAIWIAIAAARLTRFFLEEEVFERVSLSPGLPYAISTMLNYLVLFVGFLIALGVLGVDLTKITILAGAFSVGLGFGLQNIINNFVSGIILLFERPVKVGDIVQINDAIGEVRRIGIRASIIGTRDGSSIIVPNGNLISNQFTNWTYSDRHRSIEIPLSIATGTDPKHLLDLLKAAASAHSATKDHPVPEAYVTAFTGSSISVVVRAWISNYEDWVQVQSELAIDLVAALTRENVKLA